MGRRDHQTKKPPATGADGTLVATLRIEEADLVASHWVHLRPGRWLRALGWLGLVLYTSVLGLAVYQVRHHGFYPGLGLLLGLTLFLAWFSLWWYPARVRRLFRRVAASGPTELELRADQGGLHLADDAEGTRSGGSRVTPWHALHRWKEGKRVLLLYFNKVLFLTVPKRFIAPSDLDLLRGYLERAGVRRIR